MTDITTISDPTNVFTQFFLQPNTTSLPTAEATDVPNNTWTDLTPTHAASVNQYIRRWNVIAIVNGLQVGSRYNSNLRASGLFEFKMDPINFVRMQALYINKTLRQGDVLFNIILDVLLDDTVTKIQVRHNIDGSDLPDTVSVDYYVIEWPHACNDAYGSNTGTIQGGISNLNLIKSALGYSSQGGVHFGQFQILQYQSETNFANPDPQILDAQNLALQLIANSPDVNIPTNVMATESGRILQRLDNRKTVYQVPIAETSNAGTVNYSGSTDKGSWIAGVILPTGWRESNDANTNKYQSMMFANSRVVGNTRAYNAQNEFSSRLYLEPSGSQSIVNTTPTLDVAKAFGYFSHGIAGTTQNLTHKIVRRVKRPDGSDGFHGAVFNSGLTQTFGMNTLQYDCDNALRIHAVSFGSRITSNTFMYSQYSLQWDNGEGAGGPTQHNSLEDWRDWVETNLIRPNTNWRQILTMVQMLREYGRTPLMSMGGPLLGVEAVNCVQQPVIVEGTPTAYSANYGVPDTDVPWTELPYQISPEVTGEVVPEQSLNNYLHTLENYSLTHNLTTGGAALAAYAARTLYAFWRTRYLNGLPGESDVENQIITKRSVKLDFTENDVASMLSKAIPMDLPLCFSKMRLTLEGAHVTTKGAQATWIHKKYFDNKF